MVPVRWHQTQGDGDFVVVPSGVSVGVPVGLILLGLSLWGYRLELPGKVPLGDNEKLLPCIVLIRVLEPSVSWNLPCLGTFSVVLDPSVSSWNLPFPETFRVLESDVIFQLRSPVNCGSSVVRYSRGCHGLVMSDPYRIQPHRCHY